MTELKSDPDTKDDFALVEKKIENRDQSGAIALTPSLIAKAEEIAISYLGYIKSQQTTSLKQKHTPAKKPPTALAAGKQSSPPPKEQSMQDFLKTATDDDLLREMGL